jgi:hypothetical protein
MTRRFLVILLAVSLAAFFAGPSYASEVEVSGAIEVEVGFYEADNVKGEDITTSTVEVGLDAKVNDISEGHILLLYEEGDTEEVSLDEAYITLTPMEALFVDAGLYVVPFGMFETMLISDPLTLELGEISDSAVTVGYETGPITARFGTFNGDVWETGETEEKIDVYFLALDYATPEGAEMPINARVSWISSIGESEVLMEAMPTLPPPADPDPVIEDQVAGIGLFGMADVGPVTILFEYITATSKFKAADLGFAEELKPSAYNLEVGADVNEKTSVAARIGGSKDTGDLLFENVVSFAASHVLEEGTTVSAEYFMGEWDADYTAADDTTALVFQLALEF